jgi:hypothetical protein
LFSPLVFHDKTDQSQDQRSIRASSQSRGQKFRAGFENSQLAPTHGDRASPSGLVSSSPGHFSKAFKGYSHIVERGPTRYRPWQISRGASMKYCYPPFLGVLAVLLASPALADDRGDVLAGIYRCSAIADDRTWLDCFYGSAQPMRAKLGLPPAPAAQLQLVPPALPGAPPVHLVPEGSAPSHNIAKQEPGFLTGIVGDFGHPLVSKTALTSYDFDEKGMFTAALIDGQVWKQVGDNDRQSLAHWHAPASQLLVTITKGAFGTFNLVVSGEARVYKVRRLR